MSLTILLPPEPGPNAVRCECVGEDGPCDHELISPQGLAFIREYRPSTPDALADMIKRMTHGGDGSRVGGLSQTSAAIRKRAERRN